jgi:hypothetical protein
MYYEKRVESVPYREERSTGCRNEGTYASIPHHTAPHYAHRRPAPQGV